MNDYKNIFTNIYKNGIWNNNREDIPLSGPGSSLDVAKSTSDMLDNFTQDNNLNSVTDMGCGDLTWISQTNFFNDDSVAYTGVDIVDSLVDSHTKKYKHNKFVSYDITQYVPENSDLIIIRDVIFHLKNEDIIKIFKNIKYKFKHICITTDINDYNDDTLNKYHFAIRNIRQEPFNINGSPSIKIDEKKFNREVLVYKHDEFYK